LSGNDIQIWGIDAMEIDVYYWVLQQFEVGKDVRPSMTPIEHACSLGIFGDESREGHKEDVIG
jgi:hypothetical protein